MGFTTFFLLLRVTSKASSLWQQHFLPIAADEFSLQYFQHLENQSHCTFLETPYQSAGTPSSVGCVPLEVVFFPLL